jgi:hypothetical protein
METKNERTIKFFEATRVCRDFAEIMLRQADKDIFGVLDVFDKQIKMLERMLVFLGTDAPEDIRNCINWELNKLQRAQRLTRKLDKRLLINIFCKARKYIFKMDGGDATNYIRELTENTHLDLSTDIWEPNPQYPLDTKNCPVIKTINGGEYRCHSNYPTRDSEEYSVLNNIVELLNNSCEKNETPTI